MTSIRQIQNYGSAFKEVRNKKMFHNTSTIRKIQYKIGPKTWIMIILCITVIICYLIWKYFITLNISQNQYKKFSDLIYEWNVNFLGDEPEYDTAKMDIYLSSYKFDQELFPMEVVDSQFAADGLTWSSDAEAFGKTVKLMHKLMAMTIKPSSQYYKHEKIWKMVDNFIQQVESKMPLQPKDKTFPWGQNWYQFSVTFPLFMVSATFLRSHLFKKRDIGIERFLAVYTSAYFQQKNTNLDVVYSIGWERTGPNAILMASPYIGGHIIMKDFNPKDKVCKHIYEYSKLNYVTTGEGLYHCSSFIFHTSLRAYGYITSAWSDFHLVAKFFNTKDRLVRLMRILEKTEHPNIPLHFAPWFNRTSNLKSNLSKYGKLGFYTMDYMRGVSVKTDNWLISFNGQHPLLYYYESDQMNYKWGQYWFSARRFLYKDDDKELYQELVTYYPGVLSYNNIALEVKSSKLTTEGHNNNNASCILVQLGEMIGMKNIYNITFGDYIFDVCEMTLVTRTGIHCYYRIKPNLTLHSSQPFMVAVNLGKIDVSKHGSGFGQSSVFDKTTSYIYGDTKNHIIKNTIQHPYHKTMLDTLQIKLGVGGKDYGECGFSNLHSSSNELVAIPSIHGFKTMDGVLEWDEKYPEYLFLYDKPSKMMAVSNDMNKRSEKIFKIPNEIMNDKFKNDKTFKAINSNTVAGNYITMIGETQKYQGLFSDVSAPT